MAQENNRRIIFTRDAQFSLKRFAKPAGAEGDATDIPEKGTTLTGYAILWNSLSDDRGGYKVRLLPGSATFTVPTMALFHHDFSAVIGNTANNTLRIIPDDIGVRVEIDLPDTTTGRDVEELVGKKYVQGMSFAMVDAPKFTTTTEGGQKVMNVSAFTADEVTVTAIPSFTDTSIAIIEDEPAAGPISASSKKSSEPAKHRDAQAWKLQKYRLATVAEITAAE